MSKTTAENIEDRQAQMDDLRRLIDAMIGDVDSAESCETPEDFDANLDSLIAAATGLIKEAKEIRQ